MNYLNKIKMQFINVLKQGTSPEELALCVSGAIILGVFPVLGSTTLLITLFAIAFRLNLPTAQIINYLIYPLQLILLIPFMKFGESIFGIAETNYTFSQIYDMLMGNFWGSIKQLLDVTFQAILAWLIILPFVLTISYYVFRTSFRIIARRINP